MIGSLVQHVEQLVEDVLAEVVGGLSGRTLGHAAEISPGQTRGRVPESAGRHNQPFKSFCDGVFLHHHITALTSNTTSAPDTIGTLIITII